MYRMAGFFLKNRVQAELDLAVCRKVARVGEVVSKLANSCL
jgi:hypothetical protein